MKTKISKKKLKKAKVTVDFETNYQPKVATAAGGTLTTAELEAPHLFFWKTRDGQILRIADMQLDHLLNARALLRRRIAKMSEVEEAMSREVQRRTGSELSRYGTFTPSYEPIDEDYDPHPGQH
jgi:hypothetical protein